MRVLQEMCRARFDAATTRSANSGRHLHQTNAPERAPHEHGAATPLESRRRRCAPESWAGTRLALGQWMTAAPHVVTPLLWEEEIPGGSHWSGVLRRGVVLRLLAQDDDANVAALFYNREQPLERYNMADTLKAQHTAHLTTGCVCYSDMGRILCSVIADTCGWHDPLC